MARFWTPIFPYKVAHFWYIPLRYVIIWSRSEVTGLTVISDCISLIKYTMRMYRGWRYSTVHFTLAYRQVPSNMSHLNEKHMFDNYVTLRYVPYLTVPHRTFYLGLPSGTVKLAVPSCSPRYYKMVHLGGPGCHIIHPECHTTSSLWQLLSQNINCDNLATGL